MSKVLIIAEAGVNHNGSLQIAKQLVDKAVDAGVDIIKFQTFKSEKLVSRAAKQAGYQQRNIGKKTTASWQCSKNWSSRLKITMSWCSIARSAISAFGQQLSIWRASIFSTHSTWGFGRFLQVKSPTIHTSKR